MELRLKLLGLVFFLMSLVLLGKLFFWQILKAEHLSQQARTQHQSGERLLAHRGSILDAKQTWLAISQEAWLVYANKPEINKSPKTIANLLAPFFLEKEKEEENYQDRLFDEVIRIENLLEKEGVVWIPLRHQVSTEAKENIEALGLKGIGFELEEARYYPEASIAAHVLGFVGKDEDGNDKGYSGLEGYYDLPLSGKPGFLQRESDAQGVPILFGESKEISAIGGVNLITHIDKTIQMLAEKRLEEGIERYGASAGTVIVMNPKDGAVKAMVSFPAYDPAKYYEYGDEYFKNPIISDTFEPGSVFKPIIMASALDAEAVKPDTKCDVCEGPVKVDKYVIETWNEEYFPDSTMTEVIVHSDNVGMTFVANKIGSDKLFDYLEKFGFGTLTGIDLQGEVESRLRPKEDWNIVDLATASFGQGIAVTPIQLIKGIAIIANGGKEVSPQVVDKIGIDGLEQDIKPAVGDNVVSEKTAREVTEMMRLAVKEGESKWVQARGFDVAGKTGTAQIPVKGHYDEEKTIASFVGFAPAKNPKFVMLVTLREPQTSPWASETAAPLWFSIAADLFPYLGIQPEN